MNKLTRIGTIFFPILAVGYLSQALIFSPVSSSERKYSVIVAQGGAVGRFCNLNNQNGGWWIRWTTDLSQDLCSFMLNNDCSGGRCKVVNQGTYLLNDRNRVEVNCQGARGSFEGNGDQPLRAAFDGAVNRRVGFCVFQVNSTTAFNPPRQNPNIPNNPPRQNPNTPNNAPRSNYEAALLQLTNAQRQNAGLPPLRLSYQLSQAAQLHAEDMARNNFSSHTGSDGSQIPDRVRRTGYQYSAAGENIFYEFPNSSPDNAVKWWMNSPGHRANILNPNFTEIGFGYSLGNGKHHYVQVFGRPR